MRRKTARWSLLLGVASLTVTAAFVLQEQNAIGQHTPPAWPLTHTHANTPCFGGNICYVCPQTRGIARTAAQPAAAYAQGACQVGYPATKKCWDTTWSCGNEITCALALPTGQLCYDGPLCKN